MRYTIALIVVLFAATVHGADEAATASATLGGKKLQFPAAGIADGVRATVALLESCHSKREGTTADMKDARAGDHIRLVFPEPVVVRVLDDRLEVSELVLTQPLNTGVFWLRSGEKVVRCTKYEFEKEKDFVAWRDKARAAE